MLTLTKISKCLKLSVLLFFLTLSILFSSQSQPKTNSQLADSIIQAYTVKLSTFIVSMNLDTVGLKVIGMHSDLLRLKVINNLINDKIVVFSDTIPAHYPRLTIYQDSFFIENHYLEENQEYFTRTLHLNISGYIEQKGQSIKTFPPVNLSSTDTLSAELFSTVEDSPGGLVPESTLPPPRKTFFKRLLEPAIIVTSAIVTVLLLFTVRSK